MPCICLSDVGLHMPAVVDVSASKACEVGCAAGAYIPTVIGANVEGHCETSGT